MKYIGFLTAIMMFHWAQADIYKYPDREIHFSTAVQNLDYTLHLRDSSTRSDLFYKPNVNDIVVPKLAYKDLVTVSWAMALEMENEEKRLMGDTKFTDIRLDFTYHNFAIEAYYNQYSGMYLENTGEVDPQFNPGDPSLLRPDLYVRGLGVTMTWIWDENDFSMLNLVSQNERQESWGGSFLFGGSINETYFSADQSIVPTQVQSQFDVIGQIRSGTFRTLSAKAGYGYSMAKKWFLGGYIMAGPGISYRTLRIDGQSNSTGFEPTGRVELLASTGYNGDWFFGNLKYDLKQDFYLLTGSSSQINPELVTVSLALGVHLDTLKW